MYDVDAGSIEAENDVPFSSVAFPVKADVSVVNEPDTVITNEPLLFDARVDLLKRSTVSALVTTNVG